MIDLNFPRTREAGRLFWLPVRTGAGAVGLGLSGTGVRATSRTLEATEDLSLAAVTTDVDASLVTLRGGGEGAEWSNADTLIKQVAGKRLLARNYAPLRPPYLLKAGNHVKADALGAGGETGGHLVFLCDPVNNAHRRAITIPPAATPFSLVLSAALSGDNNERRIRETTPNKNRHTLVWGAGSDLRAVSIRIRDADGNWWMNDPVPIWAVCADPNASSQIIQQDWPRAYYIPPGGTLQVEFTNPASGAESNGFIYFNCARW